MNCKTNGKISYRCNRDMMQGREPGLQKWSLPWICFGVFVLCSALSPNDLRANVSVFDFWEPGADQSGQYEASTGITLEEGRATLREQYSPAWRMDGWSYRIVVSVANDTGEFLVEVPVRLDLDGAPDEIFDIPRLDGSDFVFVDSNGDIVEPRWIERFDFIARRGSIWMQLSSLPPGGALYYLYFGNHEDMALDPGTSEEVFTYSSPVASSVVLNPLAADSSIIVQSFVDGNTIEMTPSSSWNLDAREMGIDSPGNVETWSVVSATGPYFAQFSGVDTDAAVFFAYSSDVFIYPDPRYGDIFDVYALFGETEVNIFDGITLVASQTVNLDTPLSIAADITPGSAAVLESDLPVLVNKRSDNNGDFWDVMPYLPPSTEIVGVNSGAGRIAALEDGTVVDVYYSSVEHDTVFLDANQVYALSYPGSGGTGTGDGVNIRATAPVAGLSYADGDGGEAVSFMPRSELGRRYLIPRDAEYVLISAIQPGVTCRILNSDGTQADEATSDTIAPPYPNRIRFGFVNAGSEIDCNAPVYAMMEDLEHNAERNLFPVKAHRPALHPYPSASLIPGIETRYMSTEGNVVTPNLQPAGGLSAILFFRETGDIWIPAGTYIRYQLSNNGGTTWYYHDGTEWMQSLAESQANTAREIDVSVSSFPITSNRVRVKAFLESETGTNTPVLDELTLVYAGPGDPVRFVFDPIEGTQTAGVPFDVTITAVDSDGLTAAKYEGSVNLSTYSGSVFPEKSPQFENGRISFQAAVSEVGDNVVMLAYDHVLYGESNPFVVVSPDPSSLRLEAVQGDQQMGTTSEPLAVDPTVRVVSEETGYPVPGVNLVFSVTEGGGRIALFETGDANIEVAVETNAGGLAGVIWTMGENPGGNELRAVLSGAEGSPVFFTARADLPGTVPDDGDFKKSDGGCGCRTGGDSRSGVPFVLLVGILFAAWMRKKKYRKMKHSGLWVL